MRKRWGSAAALACLFWLAACGRGGGQAGAPDNGLGTGSWVNWGHNRAGQPAAFQICSKLDFTGVTWPASMTATDQEALKLALNISGSYEGESAWANLTNNFDGEGLSLGLLNQNLGTGSLQPLLIKLRDAHPEVLQRIFDGARLQSLLAMLSQWESVSAQSVNAPSLTLSLLDFPLEPMTVNVANQDSVAWAVNNLYVGSSFEPHWASELTVMADSPEYVSIQIGAAVRLHTMAVDEEMKGGVDELRAYLLMFDINVQDGGMYAQDFTDYAAYVQAHPAAAPTDRLEELLNLRLRHVKPQYVADVKSRKQTIIDGTGVVHGDSRDLPAEYCYQSGFPYH